MAVLERGASDRIIEPPEKILVSPWDKKIERCLGSAYVVGEDPGVFYRANLIERHLVFGDLNGKRIRVGQDGTKNRTIVQGWDGQRVRGPNSVVLEIPDSVLREIYRTGADIFIGAISTKGELLQYHCFNVIENIDFCRRLYEREEPFRNLIRVRAS